MSSRVPLTVIVVGGAGAMGRYAVRTIARLGSAERLIVADLDLDRATRLCDEVGAPCEPLALDVTDEAALRRAFETVDVVLCTVGPFAQIAMPVLRAAIDARCDYLDIDDDWESTLEAYELDDLARERGCRVIKGVGGSPGVSNLLAMIAAERLDEVDELHTGWKLSAAVTEVEPDYPVAPGSAPAAMEHWLLQSSGTIRAWNGGRLQDIKPVRPRELAFPGLGTIKGYTMGHPEAVTLPRTVPGLRSSVNYQTGPDWLFDFLREVGADYDAGRISLSEGAQRLQTPPRPAQRAPRDPAPVVWALAYGRRDGRSTAVAVHPRGLPKGGMGGNTGVPLAIGLDLLVRGRITATGVLAPEAAFDATEFLDAFAQHVQPAMASATALLEIVEGEGPDEDTAAA